MPYNEATAPPVGSPYTPIPGTTPAAVIESSGTSAPGGSDTPVPTVTAVAVHGGTSAAVFGQLFSNYNAGDWAYNGLCQSVTIPAGASPSFSAYVLSNGNEASKYVEDIVGVVDSSSNLINILYMENVSTTTSPGDTAFRQITVPAAASNSFAQYAGQTIILFIGMWTSSGTTHGYTYYSSYWFVDDVSLM